MRAAVPSTPLHKRRWPRVVSLLVAIAIAATAVIGLRRRGPKPIAVRVHAVERGTVRDRIATVSAGRVTAKREVVVRAEFAGTVVKVHHRRGERVKAGDPLMSYDMDDLRDRVVVAERTVALGRAQAAQAAESARLAQDNALRARRLREVGAAAPVEADNAVAQEKIAERSLDAAEAGIRQGLANVELARNALRKGIVRAPFAGLVLSTLVEEGETTAPGGPLVSIADTEALHVAGEIDESDLGKLREGMPAEIVLDAFPGRRFDGRLTLVAPSVTRDVRGNRSVAIEVSLPEEPLLRVGMSADVDVIVATREDVLWVPPAAVHGRGKERSVLVAVGGVARKRPVEVGIATWEIVEITRGLVAGEQVVVSQAANDLADGAKIEIEPAGAAAGSTPRVSAR